MRALFVLARFEARMYRDLAGVSVFDGLPFKTVVFVERSNEAGFRALSGDLDVRFVRWGDHAVARESILDAAQDHDVAAVVTADEELIELAADLRQRLSLPGMAPEVAARFRDKVRMKEAVAAAGVRVPEFVECGDRANVAALFARHGTIVVKPVRGFGSRGVEFLRSPADLERWQASCARPEEFEAEEFVEGVLYHVNALVRRREPILTVSAP